MIVGVSLEGAIDDQGRDFVVMMPQEGFVRLIECIESTLSSGGAFTLRFGGTQAIHFRPAMMVDYRASACEDGSLSVSLSRASFSDLAERLAPLCRQDAHVDRVHFDVCGDQTKPDIEALVFELL